jgi:hypothetical protein
VDERRVQVKFTDAGTADRWLPIEVRPLAEVSGLYPAGVRSALDELAAYRPSADVARRLLLWWGEPGTGKTTAVRSLLHAWRDWADGVVVADVDMLLRDGKYLRRIVLDVDDEERWQLIVLEDTEALLQKGSSSGPALGKLLNLADGMLGQGLRALFLLTTNAPINGIHPALARPGRCLARIEFGALSAAEASAAVGRVVDGPRTLAELMAEEAVSADAQAPAIGQYL